MSGTKNAAPVCETGNGAGEQAVLADFCLPHQENSTKPGRAQGGIAALLPHGEQNAVGLKQLAAWTGWDEREVRRAIQRERMAGVPILSGDGYFLPESEEERIRCVRSLRHRAGQIMAVAAAIEEGGGISE